MTMPSRPFSLVWIYLCVTLSSLEGGNCYSLGSSKTQSADNSGAIIAKTAFSSYSKANNGRRAFLISSVLAISTSATTQLGQPCNAAFGDSSNLELPNYIEFLIEKNVVTDPDSFLYKGPDPKVQLQRLLDASKRLKDIPPLAEDKKWSQVQGILTGPMGTLAESLNRISKDGSPEVQAKSKKVKEDIFAISAAASKKNTEGVIAKTNAASADLEAFVKAAF